MNGLTFAGFILLGWVAWGNYIAEQARAHRKVNDKSAQ